MFLNRLKQTRVPFAPLVRPTATARPFATQSKAKIPMSNNLVGMIEWFRRNGYKLAKTDPLEMQTQ